MKQFYKIFSFAIFTFAITSISYAQNEAIYTNTSGTTGVVDGIPFTISISSDSNSQVDTWDLSSSEFNAAPLSNNQSGFAYIQTINDGDISITFDTPISNLRLYIAVWRDMQISFNHPFTILSGNPNLQAPTTTQVTTSTYASGILEFSGDISTLVFTRISGGNQGYQLFTLSNSTALGTSDWEKNTNEITVFSNPSSNFIQVSGLTATENYRIYNILGAEVDRGSVFEKKEINIDNLVNGVYFLKLENRNSIKFVKI